MDLAEYKHRYEGVDDAAPGWDAIDSKVHAVYRGQEPQHWGPGLPHAFGGSSPIDGISAYQSIDGGMDHLHFVTYGYSSLYYDEEAVGGDYSGYGFEMTFRLASKLPPADDPIWVCNLLQNLARYVFQSGKWFEPYHWIPANGPIRAGYGTDLVGLAFLSDPTLEPIDSPHGRVEFVQAFGVTQSELDSFKATPEAVKAVIDRYRKTNPLLVTDLTRREA